MMQGMVIGDLLHGTLFASVGDFVFFKLILEYLREEIANFGEGVLGRMMTWVGSIALVLMTLWVLIQGFRIATGRSRDSMADDTHKDTSSTAPAVSAPSSRVRTDRVVPPSFQDT